jgi:hypothetical protein
MKAIEIEALGWESLGSGWYQKEASPNMGYWTHVRLRMWGDNSFIKAYRGEPNDACEQEFIFQGEISNQRDLAYIMDLTHCD